MRGSLSLDKMLRLGLIAAVILVAAITQSRAQANDVFADIKKHQEGYAKLERDIATSLRRILSSTETYSKQELEYGQLDSVALQLTAMNREFDVLDMLIAIANLVTDKRAVPNAWQIVKSEREYMIKRALASAEFIEKQMHRVKDPETSRLFLDARDLLRSSVEFLGRMRVKEPNK